MTLWNYAKCSQVLHPIYLYTSSELTLTGGTNSQGATPKAIEERIAKLKREAKAMDHPKPRNHPKGKSGPKKRVATDASLTPLETADLKKIKVMDPEDSITDPVIDPTTDSTEDSMTDPSPVSDVSSLCPAKMEDEETSPLRSPRVKYEFEQGLEPEFDTDTDTEPSAEPNTDAELESEFEPENESDLESEFKSEGEEIENRKLSLIKSEPENSDVLAIYF